MIIRGSAGQDKCSPLRFNNRPKPMIVPRSRLFKQLEVIALLFATMGCSDNGSNKAASFSCNGDTEVCQSMPYGNCVEIRQAPGHCVDWSHAGATSCVSPNDCPSSLPSGSYGPSMQAEPSRAYCIGQGGWLDGTEDSSTGFCSAHQDAQDATGAGTCSPNPCGPNGFCSYIVNAYGTALVWCDWPV